MEEENDIYTNPAPEKFNTKAIDAGRIKLSHCLHHRPVLSADSQFSSTSIFYTSKTYRKLGMLNVKTQPGLKLELNTTES